MASRVAGFARRLFPWAHEGAYGHLALVCIGLALTLLSLPPGPLAILVLVADAPLLLLLFHRNGERWKRWTFLYGALWFAFTLRWLSEVHPAEVPAAAVVLGPIFLVIGGALRFAVKRGAPFVPTAGLLFVAEEMLRTVWMGGMPLPTRSMAFAGGEPMSSLAGVFVAGAGLVGAYGLTFLAGCSCAVVSGIPAWVRSADADRKRLMRSLVLGALWPIGVAGVIGGYGALRVAAYGEREANGEVRVTKQKLVAVQAVIPQALKLKSGGGDILDKHLTVSAAALDAHPAGDVFGLVWPETMVLWPFYSPELAARFPDKWETGEVGVVRRIHDDVLRGRDVHCFIGALFRSRDGNELHEESGQYRERDSLFHWRPARGPGLDDELTLRPDPTNPNWFAPWARAKGRHDKVRLVPGGEYMPLGDWIPALASFRRAMVPIPELLPGVAHQAPFTVTLGTAWIEGPEPEDHQELKIGTIICFDLGFPDRVRTWRRDGAQILLNPANYGWFGPTDFRAQIRAMGRLRAAESNASIVMAGNTGPSCFIDPIGRMVGEFTAWTPEAGASESIPAGTLATTFVTGWASAAVPTDTYVPPYVRYGDLPWAVVVLLVVGWTLVTRRRKPRGAG